MTMYCIAYYSVYYDVFVTFCVLLIQCIACAIDVFAIYGATQTCFDLLTETCKQRQLTYVFIYTNTK